MQIALALQAPLRGGIMFASPEAQVQRTAELLGEGALVVAIPPLPPTMRGHLADHLEEHLERALAERGAPSPYLAAWSAMPDDAEERLADQLFRARTVGSSGIALAMGSIAAASCPTLTPEDSATLRWLAVAAQRVPLVVMIDDADTFAPAFDAPVALAALLVPSSTQTSPPPPPVEETRNETLVAECVPEEIPVIEAEPEPEPAVEPEPETPVLPAKQPKASTAGIPVVGPNDFWRAWALALGAVRGPLPLGAFERLFAENYVPLANAIACGLDDPRAHRAYDEFRRTFEHAYTEAFATFGATNRRPRLVMDAYDIAAKQARLHNARTSQVLVIDSLRFDLGSHFRDALVARANGIVTLTGETVLWSALPTTTIRQLETLARGMDALRAPATEDPSESLRGRTAETVRRLRVGSRELYKLDVVPTMLASLGDEPGAENVVASLEEIAAHTADAVARHLEHVAPRTLIFVIGDHGFTVDRRGSILHGGASPEEVLVPAYSFLTGELH